MTTRTVEGGLVTSVCSTCGESVTKSNQGLGRAFIAAWESQHGPKCEVPAKILAGLSPDQRAAMWALSHGPRFLGAQPPAVPRGTAAALRRRGLIEDDGGGSMVRLTELGRTVATEHARCRMLVFPPDDGTVRMSAIMHARQGEIYSRWVFAGMVGSEVQLRKDLGGSYSGTLVSYEVIENGAAVKVTIDVPVGETAELREGAMTRLSLPGTP